MNGNPLIFHAAIGFSSIYPEPAYLKTSFKVSGKQEYCPTAEWMKFHTFSSLLFPESVDTGSITPYSVSFFRSSDALDGLISMTFITSDRPKIAPPGKASRSLRIWLSVLGGNCF